MERRLLFSFTKIQLALLLALIAGTLCGQQDSLSAARTDGVHDQLQALNARLKHVENAASHATRSFMDLSNQVRVLTGSNKDLEQSVVTLRTELEREKAKSDSIGRIANELRQELVAVNSQSQTGLDGLNARVNTSSRSLWFTGAGLLCLIGLTFWGTRKILESRSSKVEQQMGTLNDGVQEKLVHLDTEILGTLQKLLQIRATPFTPAPIAEVDHSLALKVADELTRIEQNLSLMDPGVKGFKQLSAAVKRMHENLQAAGYALPQLLGKPYDEGLKVTAAFVPDDSLQLDERVITRVFKPTVLFQGKMIQSGDIQVSQG